MQFENTDNKLSYQGDTDQGYSVYHMILAGRVVFQVRVNKDETGMPIEIHYPADQPQFLMGGWTKTALRAFTVEDKSRISAMSMKEAVYGNLPYLMADLMYGPIAK